MPGFHTPALLALLFAFFASTAHADESGLEGAFESVRPDQPIPTPAPTAVPDESQSAEPIYVQAQKDLTPKESPRFTAEESSRLGHWLIQLCRQEAVAPELAKRVRFGRDSIRTELSAGNKQGSLVLLLDNYAELAAIHDQCATKRKTNPGACVERKHLAQPFPGADIARSPWMSISSGKFWSEVNSGRTPAGIEKKIDLLRETAAQLNDLRAVLKKEFFDFRDAADLGQKESAATSARQLSAQIRAQSTCGTRAVAERIRVQK